VNKTGIPYLDFAWNPGGFGCSHGCPTCWARRQATSTGPTAPACPDCRKFLVHFHPERLRGKLAPDARKTPAVVGVQFLGDLFDLARPDAEPLEVLDACLAGCQHTYVFLTRQYERARASMGEWYRTRIETHGRGLYDVTSRHWYVGTTCCTQEDYDRAAYLCGNTAWPWWVSMEPLTAPIVPGEAHRPRGVVIGSDNQRTADCGVGAIRTTVRAFEAVGVPVYVKQMWLWHCPNCGASLEDHHAAWKCYQCGHGMLTGLETNPTRFPVDLQRRDLPWTLTLKREGGR
jgi:protein gp37